MLTPKSLPKWDQNRTKKRPKIDAKYEAKKEAKKDRLETVLGRSWVIFGRPLGSKMLIFHWFLQAFRENSLFAKNIASRAVLDRTWPDLGRFWLPFWHLFGAQNGQKTKSKKQRKKEPKKERKRPSICQKPVQQANGKRRLSLVLFIFAFTC